MQDAKPLIDHWLTEYDYFGIAQSVVDAYRACDKFCNSNTVTESFPPGVELRSNFLNVFVQHALWRFAERTDGYYYEIKPNAARNCRHTRIHKGTLSLTAHFVGRGCDRSSARSALYLGALASKNFDLFSSSDNVELPSHLHCQLLHGGWVAPQVLSLGIPTADQSNLSHAMTLTIPKVNLTNEEKIREKISLQLLESTIEFRNEKQTS